MKAGSPRSLRRAYVDWVEEQIEEFKDRIPRGELLSLADEVVNDLRVNDSGQYQLTEILLCNAIDRRIVRMLKLPGYRTWAAQRRKDEEHARQIIRLPAERPLLTRTEPLDRAPESEPVRILAVVG
jgi:hypothetical protein